MAHALAHTTQHVNAFDTMADHIFRELYADSAGLVNALFISVPGWREHVSGA